MSRNITPATSFRTLVYLPKLGLGDETPVLSKKLLANSLLTTPSTMRALDWWNIRKMLYITNGSDVWSWMKSGDTRDAPWSRVFTPPIPFTEFSRTKQYTWAHVEGIVRAYEEYLADGEALALAD